MKTCPTCGSDDLVVDAFVRTFKRPDFELNVDLLMTRCCKCNLTFTTSKQHDKNLKILEKHNVYQLFLKNNPE